MSNTSGYQFLANIILRGKIKVITGLHIGGSKDKFEIGGVDNPVIRDPFTGYPYIPGSSLKGKMRMLLEFEKGVVKEGVDKNGNPTGTYPPSTDDKITILFGSSAEDSSHGPTRLIVRDAYPDDETIAMWKNLDSETLYAEYKAENTIDRMTSAANPRWMERVVKDSKFDFEMVIGIYNMDSGNDHYKDVKTAMKLLEDSTLGGGGSRGSGKIIFENPEEKIYSRDYYLNGSDEINYSEDDYKKLFNSKDNNN